LDADDASAFTLVSGNVSEWRDKSGSGVPHATQASAGSRPARTSSGLNGRAVVDFQGTHALTFASSTAAFNFLHNPTGGTVFLVLKPDTSSNPDAIKYILNNTNNSSANTGVSISADDRSSVSRNNFLGVNVNRGVNGVTTSGIAANNFIPAMDSYLVTTLVMDNGNAVAASRLLGRANGVQNAAANSLTNAAATGNATLDLTMGNFGGGGACSGVAEVIFYEGVLSASAIARVERYLSTKWAITLGVPTATNADAQAWINNVYANGGTVSTATANAVNTFCNDIESAGIRDRFYRLNLFAGTGLSAALVPLYRGTSLGGTQFGGTTDTNTNFVSGDYSETAGLTTTAGGGKYLNTGLSPNSMALADVQAMHLAVAHGPTASADLDPRPLGANSAADRFQIVLTTRTASVGLLGVSLGRTNSLNSSNLPTGVQPSASWVVSRTSATALVIYKNGSADTTLATSVTGILSHANAFTVGRANNAGTIIGDSAILGHRHYSIGAAMTAAQVAAYESALAAFRSAIGRTA